MDPSSTIAQGKGTRVKFKDSWWLSRADMGAAEMLDGRRIWGMQGDLREEVLIRQFPSPYCSPKSFVEYLILRGYLITVGIT